MFNFHTHQAVKNGINNIDSFNNFAPNLNQYYSLGSHPWYKKISINCLEQHIKESNQIVAIGECGLDKINHYYPFEEQIQILKEQIELSEKLELPLILHIVKSFNEIITLKKEFNPKQKWVIHGVNNYKQVTLLVKAGFYLSFGTSLLTNEKLQNEFKTVPSNKIFLETDDSDLKIEKLYTFAAQLKSIELNDLVESIRTNLKTITNGKLA